MSSRQRHNVSRATDPTVRLSKTLSWILRHGAAQVGLDMQPDGFVKVDDVLSLPQLSGHNLTDLQQVTADNAKQRFAMRQDGEGRWLIRANQGHTLPVGQMDMSPISSGAECPTAVHGTQQRHWSAIKQYGLSRMQRQHIHMATGVPTDKRVVSGMRQSCNVYIYIDVPAALRDGIPFYRSANGVILSPGNADGVITSPYFQRVCHVQRDGTTVELDID